MVEVLWLSSVTVTLSFSHVCLTQAPFPLYLIRGPVDRQRSLFISLREDCAHPCHMYAASRSRLVHRSPCPSVAVWHPAFTQSASPILRFRSASSNMDKHPVVASEASGDQMTPTPSATTHSTTPRDPSLITMFTTPGLLLFRPVSAALC